MPDTLKDHLYVAVKGACFYHVIDILSYLRGNNVLYFGILNMDFNMSVSSSFVEDNINRALCFKLSIQKPTSSRELIGNQMFISSYIYGDKYGSISSLSSGGICAINTTKYIKGEEYKSVDILEPTIIELFSDSLETRFYLKYLNDGKNVPLQSLSNITKYGVYNINFTMPVYLEVASGEKMLSKPTDWNQVESFRA